MIHALYCKSSFLWETVKFKQCNLITVECDINDVKPVLGLLFGRINEWAVTEGMNLMELNKMKKIQCGQYNQEWNNGRFNFYTSKKRSTVLNHYKTFTTTAQFQLNQSWFVMWQMISKWKSAITSDLTKEHVSNSLRDTACVSVLN